MTSCIDCRAGTAHSTRCWPCTVAYRRAGAAEKMAARFQSKVDRRGPDECWPWTGNRTPKGYGYFYIAGRAMRSVPAHVVAWELEHGEAVPTGRLGCHTCDNPPCVNPRHIFVGTHQDNTRDALEKGRLRLRRGGPPISTATCQRGHPRTAESTFIRRNGERTCRICRDASHRAYMARRKAAA